MSEFLAGIIGALVGTLGSWLILRWQLHVSTRDEIARLQLDLLRRLVRHKDGPELAACLNEVPVIFSGVSHVLSCYRDALPSEKAPGDDSLGDHLVALFNSMAGHLKISALDRDLLLRGFRV